MVGSRSSVTIIDDDRTPLTAEWVNAARLHSFGTRDYEITLKFNKNIGTADVDDLKAAISATAATVKTVAKTDNQNFLVTVESTDVNQHVRLSLPNGT